MGQSQFLLIILALIIVAVAIAIAVGLFTASATSANRDAVSSDLNNLASLARQHYRRIGPMGGGNNSFDGSALPGRASAWSVPTGLDTTANGYYAMTSIAAGQVILVGVGIESGDDPNYAPPAPFAGLGNRVTFETTITTTINARKLN